jgi:acetyl/propionyl-CoA carboxylase alpha subunit
VARLRRALDETLIGGVQTDLGFLRWLVDQPSFADGRYDTSLIPQEWGSGPPLTDEQATLAAVAAIGARRSDIPRSRHPQPRDLSGWGRAARTKALRS